MPDYSVIFSVIDKYSAPILAMEEKLRHLGEVGAQANKMMTPHQHLFRNLAEDAEAVTGKVRAATTSIVEMGGRVGELLGPLSALGAAGSVAGIVEMTHNFAEATEQLQIGAKIAGTTTQQLQSLQYAAKMTGVSTDGLQHSMGILNKNLGAAGSGRNKDVVSLLAHLHIALRGANGQILSSAQLLPKLADAFAHTSDPAMQALMATKLFGRSGLELLPLLEQGSAGLDEFTESFKRYGYTLSAQDVTAGVKFNETWKNMQVAISGLTDDISAKLAPVLTPIIQQIADWTAKNRDWIASGLADALKSVIDNLKKIDFKTIGADLMTFGSDTMTVVGYLGGFKTILIGAGAAMTVSFLAPLITLTAQMASFAFMSSVTVASALIKMGAEFLTIAPMITNFRNVFAALDLVISANPLGALILTAALAGTAALLLWKNWDQVKTDLISAWHALDAAFHAVWDPINKDLDAFETKMKGITDFFTGNSDDTAAATAGGSNAAIAPSPGGPRRGGGWGRFDMGGNSTAHTFVMNFPNAPPGTTVTQTSGPSNTRVIQNLGYNNMAGGH